MDCRTIPYSVTNLRPGDKILLVGEKEPVTVFTRGRATNVRTVIKLTDFPFTEVDFKDEDRILITYSDSPKISYFRECDMIWLVMISNPQH